MKNFCESALSTNETSNDSFVEIVVKVSLQWSLSAISSIRTFPTNSCHFSAAPVINENIINRTRKKCGSIAWLIKWLAELFCVCSFSLLFHLSLSLFQNSPQFVYSRKSTRNVLFCHTLWFGRFKHRWCQRKAMTRRAWCGDFYRKQICEVKLSLVFASKCKCLFMNLN